MDQTKKTSPRWFIWTIVFLVVAGTLLVLYINVSSTNFSNDFQLILPVHKTKQITPSPTQNTSTTSGAMKPVK